MLQDLAEGRLENEFRTVFPTEHASVICFSDSRVLVSRGRDDTLRLPSYSQVCRWAESGDWPHWNRENVQYVFRIYDTDYFLWMGEAGPCDETCYSFEPVRRASQLVSKHISFAVMTAWHLFVWYRDNRFCGRCGSHTVHDERERMMLCPSCGNMIFPKIAPAVIVAVTDGDRLLMSKYAHHAYKRYALLAGFVEIGETAEQAVRREVMEEVGLRVKNIRYYKSQPWGIDSDLLLGYFCDLDGNGHMLVDHDELATAEWFQRDALPERDNGISLTHEMIRVFEAGKEPR